MMSRPTQKKSFGVAFCTECTGQENELEFIPTVEMETRHHVEGIFGNEFPTICSHCGVMAAWSRSTWKNCHFLRFMEKRPVTGKFQKFCSESFHRDTDRHVVFKFRGIWLTGNRRNRALFTGQKTKLCLVPQLSLLRGSRSQSVGASPRQCTQSAAISSKSVPFRWSYIRTREHRQSALQSESNIPLKPSFDLNKNALSIGLLSLFTFCNFVTKLCLSTVRSATFYAFVRIVRIWNV